MKHTDDSPTPGPNHRGRPRPRRWSMHRLGLLGTAAAFALVTPLGMSTGVGAAPPVVTPPSGPYPLPNPCTGQMTELTIQLVITDPDGAGPAGGTIRWEGSTSDGYITQGGTGTQMSNDNVFVNQFTRILRHEDGSAFVLQGGLIVDVRDRTVRMERQDFRCLGDS